MADERDDGDATRAGGAGRAKRSATPIRLCPPRAVPMSGEDYQQAVTAPATMIADWWRVEQEAEPT